MLFSLKLAPLKFGALGGCLCRLCQKPAQAKVEIWIENSVSCTFRNLEPEMVPVPVPSPDTKRGGGVQITPP